jgi:hypothetical protein
MKSYLLAGRLAAALVVFLGAASCAGLPAPVEADAGSGGFEAGYRRRGDVAAFAGGSPESAIGLMRAAAGEPYALYLKLREGSETAEPDTADPLKLPFEAGGGSTSPVRVVINGGGRTVSLAGAGGGPLLTVGDGVTLTLRNITFTGTDGNNAPLVVINGKGARLVLGSGAVIRGNTNTDASSGQAGGVLVTEGTLELAGGEVKGNSALGGGSAGGVYVAAAGKLAMSGGEISGNSAGDPFSGGGVYVAPGGDVAISGGEISGGGVYMDGGTFDMKGGSINGDTVLMDYSD